MTVQASNLQSEQLPDAGGSEADPAKVAGQSPTRLAVDRFRHDKLSMVSFVIVVVYMLAAIAAPFLVKFGVLDPIDVPPEPHRPVDRAAFPIGKLRRHQLAPPARASSPAPGATSSPGSGTASRSPWRSRCPPP